MKKSYYLLLFVSAMSFVSFGQKFKTENIKTPINLPAADFMMTAEDRYKVVMPEAIESLTYNRTNEGGGGFSGLRISPSLEAKYENSKKGEVANYIFEVVSSGISNIVFEKPYMITYEIVNPDQTRISKQGYVANFSFGYDFKVLVKDKQQNIIRTILISDEKERYKMVYHANFFKVKETFDKWLTVNPIGFSSLNEFEKSIKNTDPKLIEMRASKNQLEIFFAKASRALSICYDKSVYKRSYLSMNTLSKVEPNSPLSPLMAAVDTQQVIMTAGLDTVTFATIGNRLKPVIETYEKFYAEQGKNDRDVRKLTQLNLFVCYYYSGMFEKAKELYNTFYSENSWGPNGFGESFDLFCAYYEFKLSKNGFYTHSFLESADQFAKLQIEKIKEAKLKEQLAKEEAEKQKQQSYLNKRKAELIIYKSGTVYDKNGKDYNGIVDMQLGSLPGSGNMINLDAGKVVNLIDESTQKLKKYFRLDDINYVFVDGARYHPIELATRLLASTKLLKFIDQQKSAELYYEPSGEDYYCKMAKLNKAYKISDLLEFSKVTESFYEAYPSLKEKLKDKKVDLKDESSVKELVKFIGETVG